MKFLSRPAQAVLDAAQKYEINPECYSRQIAAAAIRAAADQVVPENTGLSYTRQDIRAALLAIADELEGQ